MSIRFIIGRSGTGKTQKMITQIKAECDALPGGDPIFVLVPDQMSFHTEYQLLKQSKSPSLMRVQGLSFSRLAYRILQETGGLSRHHLNEVGLALLLQKVMNEKKHELTLFPSYINTPGFIQKVSEILTEFKSYCISPEALLKTLEAQKNASKSLHKLNDLATIYQAFSELTLNTYLMKEDYFTLLSEQIGASLTVAKGDFYIDGYHLFNKQEELIIFGLMKYAKSVTIILTHDPHSTSQVFALPSRTMQRLVTGIEKMGLTYEIEELKQQVRFDQTKALADLEQNFLQPARKPSEKIGVSFFSAANLRIEVEEVARRIYYLVHHQGYTYSDIAIYTATTDNYHDLLTAIFPKFGIPFFLDQKESMLNHSLMTLLYHVFDVFLHGWRHETMFTLLKTGLFIDVSEIKKEQSFYQLYEHHHRQIDQLENYCLARNIHKQRWQAEIDWKYERYRGLGRDYVQTDEDLMVQQQLNQLRHSIANQLSTFEKALEKAKAYKDFAVETFKFLETMAIPQKLNLFEETAAHLGELGQQKLHEQVWNQMLVLFEQLVEIGGEATVTLNDFTAVFKAGLESMTYATVPPRLDQVSIGQLQRARYQLVNDLKEAGRYGIKHAFVLGINEGEIPQIKTESSLINEREREQLKELGLELAPSLEQTWIDEQFILYTVFTSPSDSLTLSYIRSNDEGKEFLPSYIYDHLKKLFPKAVEEQIGHHLAGDVYQHLTTPTQSVAPVIAHLKEAPEKRSYYEPILTYYQHHFPLIYQMISQALNYQNEVTALDGEITKQLYSEEIVASVSRIELFNQCEFAHYLRYGLGLADRELYQLDFPHIGELYHEALKRIATLIQQEKRTFADLTVKECETLSHQVAEELSEQLLYQILKQNKRMQQLTNRLAGVLKKTLIGLKYQGANEKFKPLFFELAFGVGKKSRISLKSRPLNNDFRLSLRGVIDRIDLAQTADKAYLRVIDYKSSGRPLNLDAVYYGLSLQLLTYLDVALANSLQLIGTRAEAGGLLYFHVHHPFINQDEELLPQENLSETLAQMQQEQYKMTGYLPEDYEVALLSDHRLKGEKTKSDIVPITLKKDGSFSSVGNALLTSENFDLLRTFAKGKIESSAIKITEGQLNINPSQHNQTKACDYCSYRGICQFDADFLGNNLRKLPKMKSDSVIEAIKNDLQRANKSQTEKT